MEGYVVCDAPNSELYEFKGALNITSEDNKYSEEVCILSENQLLLKGSKLMNTDWVIGIVVYTGTETKLM